MLPLFVVAHFAHHLLTALPAPLLPFIRNDFKLDYTQSSLVITAFAWAYGVGQLPAGWLANLLGLRILIAIGILGVAVVGVLVGISQTYIMLLVFLVLMGLAGGGYHPAATPYISTSVEPEKRGRALGFHLIGGSGSYFLAPIIAASIAAAWGWRGSFLGLAVPAAVFGIIFYIFLGRQAGVGRAKKDVTEHLDETAPPSGHLRRLVAFMTLSILTGGLTMSTTSLMPLYIVDHFGAAEETAAKFLAIVYSAGLWAGPVGGYLSDRVGRVPIILAVSFLSGCCVYLFKIAPYGLGIGVMLFFMGVLSFVRMPVSEAYIMGQTAPRNRSKVYGIYYFAMQEAGAIFAPVLGFLYDSFGFHSGFTIICVAIIGITLICSAFLWSRE